MTQGQLKTWAPDFTDRQFPREVSDFCEATLEWVIPSFGNIDRLAKEAGQKEWDRLCSLPADGAFQMDRSDRADKARAIEQARYDQLQNIRQGYLNLAVVGLYHLFEQQLIYFYRLAMQPSSQAQNMEPSVNLVKDELKKVGLDLESLPSWGKVHNELRLLANAAKHAEGPSSHELERLRKDLFVNPFFADLGLPPLVSLWVFQPLVGNGIFVRDAHIKEYSSALTDFWAEFSRALRALI